MDIDNTELIEHVELCDVEENKESEEGRENVSCPYCQNLFSNSKEVLKLKLIRKMSPPSAKNFFWPKRRHSDTQGGALSCYSKFVIFSHIHDTIQISLLYKAHIE